MGRHSPTTDKVERIEKHEGDRKITSYKREVYIKEEETVHKKRHYDDYASSPRSTSSHSHGSTHNRHGSATGKPERVRTDSGYEMLEYRREERHSEKRSKYPDNNPRSLPYLYDTNSFQDRLVRQADHGGKGKNHRNEAREQLREFDYIFGKEGR